MSGLHYVVILLARWSVGEAIGYFTRALPRASSFLILAVL